MTHEPWVWIAFTGLVLTLMDSTVAPLAGVASEAWLRALFTTAVFQELSD